MQRYIFFISRLRIFSFIIRSAAAFFAPIIIPDVFLSRRLQNEGEKTVFVFGIVFAFFVQITLHSFKQCILCAFIVRMDYNAAFFINKYNIFVLIYNVNIGIACFKSLICFRKNSSLKK